MYPVPISSLRENTIISNDLYDAEGNLLFLRGTRLKPRILEFFKRKGINQIYFLDRDNTFFIKADDGKTSQESIQTAAYLSSTVRKYKDPGTFPLEFLDAFMKELRHFYLELPFNDKPDFSPIQTRIVQAVQYAYSARPRSLALNDLILFQDDLVSHSINVALISLLTGLSLNISHEHMQKVILGALFHDIGLLEFGIEPWKNINRSLTDGITRIPLSSHPELGSNLLKQKGIKDEIVTQVVYNHHERFDGLGYPRRMKGDEISPECALITLANEFVTLSSLGTLTGFIPGCGVMNQIIRRIGSAFVPSIARRFIEMVGIYPPGTFILLSNGETGMVVDNPSGNVLTPRVVILNDFDAEEGSEPVCRNLSENTNLSISQVLDHDFMLRFDPKTD